jgi:hypothetical protein
MGNTDPMRMRFHAAFGLIFFPCSPAMVQKCWRALQQVPEPERLALIDTLLQAAVATQDAI